VKPSHNAIGTLSGKVILIASLLICSLAQAQYVPSQTIVRNVDTIHVRAGGQSDKTMESMIRIDTPQGVKEDGERKISFNEKLETLEILEAYTLQPNGERIDVTPDKIRKLDGEDLDAYSDSKIMVMIFSKVEVGSQLYFKAKSKQHTPELPGHFILSEYFTPHYRFENAEFVLTHDADVALTVDTKGMEGSLVAPLPSDGPGVKRYRFVFKQDQAYPSEPGRVDLSDFAPYFAVSTFANYAEFAQAYQSRAKPMAAVTPAIAALAQELVAGAVDDRAKVRKLYNWVSGNIRYVAEYVGAGGYVPHSADSVLSNRYGDCKDHVVLLEALLAAVGIDSSPALINADLSFTLPKLPISTPFSHVITYIPQLDLYLDSTSPFSPMGTLPESDMGKPVLLTATGKFGQTPKQSALNDYTMTESDLVVHGDGKVSGTSTSTLRGSFEVSSRNAHFLYKNQEPFDVVNSILKRFQETGVGEFLKNEPSNLETPWVVASKFELDPVVNVPGPSAMTFPHGVTNSRLKGMSSFKPPSVRRFPLECTSARYTETTRLNFPSSVEIERIPGNVRFQRGAIEYQASYTRQGQQVSATRVYTAQRKNPFCDDTDNRDWHAFRIMLQRDLRAQVFFK
jgi:hypothetical protein